MLAPLNRVIVFVGDVQRCAQFYRDAFDLAFIPSDDPAAWQELDAGRCRLAFHKAHGPDGPVDAPTGGPMNPHKIAFFAEDVVQACAELERRGVQMGKVNRFGDLHLCDGADPEGHRFQISNRPRTGHFTPTRGARRSTGRCA
ncbi:MAG: VOC family protein [Phycisphaeraceae bacterium]